MRLPLFFRGEGEFCGCLGMGGFRLPPATQNQQQPPSSESGMQYASVRRANYITVALCMRSILLCVARYGHTSSRAGAEGRRGRPAASTTATAAVAAGAPRTMNWGYGRQHNRTVHRCCWYAYTCMQRACVPFLHERKTRKAPRRGADYSNIVLPSIERDVY